MTDQTVNVTLESAVYAFLPVYADPSSEDDAEAWRKRFAALCSLLVQGEGSELFQLQVRDATALIEAKLEFRFRGELDAARFFTRAVLQLALRATYAARRARAEKAFRLVWDGTGGGNPENVAAFEPAILRQKWAGRLSLVEPPAAPEHSAVDNACSEAAESRVGFAS
ncbi:hypothetical protein AMST5_03051 [freshwater sediment metagenome]|uniref:Uncharacterized protein n=1 Tax=freshwater sediment metagenome TaxID=556182 RepID=A0AA48RF23_9ZZZZ